VSLNTGISLFKVSYLLLDYGERIRLFMGDCKGVVGSKRQEPYDPCLYPVAYYVVVLILPLDTSRWCRTHRPVHGCLPLRLSSSSLYKVSGSVFHILINEP